MVLAAMLKESVMKKARKEMREERRKLWEEAYARFGVEVNGVLRLPQTPEVQRFLDGEAAE